jgi:hypothetical protein
MPVSLSAVSTLSGGACSITLVGESGSVTFDIKHKNIPTETYICLLEVSTIGVALNDLGKGIVQDGTDDEKVESIRELQPKIQSVKERFRSLPRMLASIVTWQDIKDGDSYVEPSESFFAALPIEIQTQYAGGLIAKKSQGTPTNSDNSQTGSTPEGSSAIVPHTISLTAPLNITDVLDGNCSPSPMP